MRIKILKRVPIRVLKKEVLKKVMIHVPKKGHNLSSIYGFEELNKEIVSPSPPIEQSLYGKGEDELDLGSYEAFDGRNFCYEN